MDFWQTMANTPTFLPPTSTNNYLTFGTSWLSAKKFSFC